MSQDNYGSPYDNRRAAGYQPDAYRQQAYPQQAYPQQGYAQQAYSRQQADPRRQQAYGQQQAYVQQLVSAQVGAAKKRGRIATVVVGLVCLVLGAVIAFFLGRFLPMGGGTGGLSSVPGTLSEAQLSTTVGTYVFDGVTYDISARDAILGSESLSAARRADGSFDAPSADMVLSYARNQILAKLVADSGIVVSDDEVYSYAMRVMGSGDPATVAAYLNMDADQAWQTVRAAAAVSKLKDVVVGSSADVPAPAYPADGDTELGHPEYADYIMGLIGTNWDWTTMSWANTDNPYYQALQNALFAQGSASYEAAQLAYNVALTRTAEHGTGAMSAWTTYVNEYLDKGAIVVYTLRA